MNFPNRRLLGGFGTLSGPSPNTQYNSVVELITLSLPLFAASALKDGIKNENGLNSLLTLFISKVARQKTLPFIAHHQSMEDMTRGDSPSPDIGIHLDVSDDAEPPPKITVFEGKRLSTCIGPKRRREYVVGHNEKGKHVPCGGIERFKLSIHGREFKQAGMIGYVQEGTPEGWRDKINTWISELSGQHHDLPWLVQEQLTPLTTEGQVTGCSSVVCRGGSNLHLTHFWINLIK